jgi:hypothetical protein
MLLELTTVAFKWSAKPGRESLDFLTEVISRGTEDVGAQALIMGNPYGFKKTPKKLFLGVKILTRSF